MPFVRPSLQALRDRTAAEVASKLKIGPLLSRGPLRVLSDVQAGHSHMHHGHLDWIALQIMPDTAETEQLDRWAGIWEVLRKAAISATGFLTVTGSGTTLVPKGTQWKRADGAIVETDADANLVAGTKDIAVTAVTADAASNSAIGVNFSIVTPVTGINTTAIVADDGAGGGLTNGSDQESDSLLRGRLLARIQKAPHGGNANDYETWAKEVAGVSRVWVFPQHTGAGTVGVFFVRDGDGAGSLILPDAAEVALVQAKLDLERPVTAAATAYAPVGVNLDPAITLVPNTATVQAAVTAALEDLLVREAAVAGTLLWSHINEAISNAVGETDHTLTSPSGDVSVDPGELSLLGTPVYS